MNTQKSNHCVLIHRPGGFVAFNQQGEAIFRPISSQFMAFKAINRRGFKALNPASPVAQEIIKAAGIKVL